MSRDSSGESLEAILASIRRSLAEQATSVLDEEAVAPVELLPPADGVADLDAPPLPAGLSRRLADAPIDPGGEPAPKAEELPATGEAMAAAVRQHRSSGLSPSSTLVPATEPGQEGGSDSAVVVPAPNGDAAPGRPVAPAAVIDAPTAVHAAATRVEPVSSEAADAAAPATQKDPLWFLSQEPGPQAAQPTGTIPAQKGLLDTARATPVSEPRPSRLGVMRGPLPPFFGSSAEVAKETAPAPPLQPLTPSSYLAPPPVPPAAQPLGGLRTANGEARDPDAAPRAADSAGGARASSIFGPPSADAGTGGGAEAPAPQIQALEAMVAELLRPMLRRWLDENMPRLVSAALKAEAELMSRPESGRDPKKP